MKRKVVSRDVEDPETGPTFHRRVGTKLYALADHLGSVRAVVGDVKNPASGGTFTADVMSVYDYEAYGVPRPGLGLDVRAYWRYGFQGMLKQSELLGSTTDVADYLTPFRSYDARSGRWRSHDPIFQPWESTYLGMGGNPAMMVDPWGLDGGSSEFAGPPAPTTGQTVDLGDGIVKVFNGSQWLKGVQVTADRPTNWNGSWNTFGLIPKFDYSNSASSTDWSNTFKAVGNAGINLLNSVPELANFTAYNAEMMYNNGISAYSDKLSDLTVKDIASAYTFVTETPLSKIRSSAIEGLATPQFAEGLYTLTFSLISLRPSNGGAALPRPKSVAPPLAVADDVVGGAAKGGSNLVYQGFDKAGVVRYVGITERQAAVRFGEHLSSGTAKSLLRYEVVPGATNLSRTGARVWEQGLINQYGLQKNGGLLLNKINSISPTNWWQYGIK